MVGADNWTVNRPQVLPSVVQKITEKFTDQRVLSSRFVTTASNNHYPFSINRMSLTELPNESENVMESPASSAQPKEPQNNSDSANLVGNKRQQSLATIGSTGHLVYVRRKIETEHGKTNISSNCDAACSSGVEVSAKTEMQQEQSVRLEDQKNGAEEGPRLVETKEEINNYWTERFNCLQEHLKYLDQSGSKDYADKLRNLSIEELNKYAIELEKRAIRLSLEEGVQSKLVKELNLLGKSLQ